MTTDATCKDCISLIAATSRAYRSLQSTGTGQGVWPYAAFKCVTCNADWICGPYGLARLSKEDLAVHAS